MADNNVLLSPQTLVDTVANASKEGDAGNEQRQPPQQQDRQAPTATDDRQEPEMADPMIPQSPPHVQGPPDLHPLHDGAGSPLPPEFGVFNTKEQSLLAPTPLQANRDADYQVQFLSHSREIAMPMGMST